ncbi:MAG: ankyrin repeat domain-containing protein, partial [Steroidobacteraceae bacterium]
MRALCAVILIGAYGTAAAASEAQVVEAVKAANRQAALALIEQHADVRATEPDGTTALHWAAFNRDADLVDRLLRAGADANAANDYGSTPLAVAAVDADPVILSLLLKAGANVESANAEGETALMVVARTGNVEAARLLLRRHANVNAAEQWGGQTALMWATAQQHPDMVELLIKSGAKVNARATVREWPRRITAEGRPKDLLRAGLTPLLYAAREGCIKCARHLLAAGADIDMPDPDGTTPLVIALLNLHFDFARVLIESGADVNRWDFFGRTPLYVAIDMNALPRGGRADLPPVDDTPALAIAEMLLQRGANRNAQLKLRPPYRNVVNDRGGDNLLSTGATPLLLAAKVGDAEAITMLIKAGALLELPTATGVTPLMAAAGMGHSFNPTRGRFKTDAQALVAVRLLKEAGGKIDLQSGNGTTALHAAASHGWNETIRYLVANGAALETRDEKGLTPIDYAAGKYER